VRLSLNGDMGREAGGVAPSRGKWKAARSHSYAVEHSSEIFRGDDNWIFASRIQ